MWMRIKHYFTLPVFEDEEKTRVARLLLIILITLSLAVTVVDAMLLVLFGVPVRLVDVGPFVGWALIVAATFSSFPLIRKGYATGLAAAIVSLIWFLVTYWIWAAEGLGKGHTSYAYALIIVIAGLLLGARGAVVFTGLGLLAVLVAYYAEHIGAIPASRPVSVVDFVIIVVVLGLMGAFLRYAMKSMRSAILRAEDFARAQAAANRELDAIRVSLEQRVAERTADLERRSIQLQAVAEVGRSAAALRDLDELLGEVAKMIGESLDFYHVGIFLLDENRLYAVLRAANSPEGQHILAQGYSVTVGSSDIIGVVTANRELRIASAASENAVSVVSSLLPRTQAELALPLIAGDRLIGVLDLHSLDAVAYTAQTTSVMQLLADQIAIAIENARLFAQREKSLEAERRAYGQISREAWHQISRVEGALRFVVDTPGSVRQAAGETPSAMLQARQTGQLLTEEGSTLAVPIQLREGVNIGALRLRKPEWAADEITLVETLTEQLGAALESARLYQETQRREARERITREITEDIRRSVDIEMILQSAVTSLGEALGVPRAYVRLMLEEADVPSAEQASPESPPVMDFSADDNAAARMGQGEVHHES
ncbi:MAG TPA: GAF domain-containing protein [Anaerolineae bacterium]|nr:GAF domain-containing protein [Anaerolineae bacterium]HQI83954.1 GAF domain-containing protein [Anaerolineae bacterium]